MNKDTIRDTESQGGKLPIHAGIWGVSLLTLQTHRTFPLDSVARLLSEKKEGMS